MADASSLAVEPVAPRSIAAIAAFRDPDRMRAVLQAEFAVPVPATPCFVTAAPLTLSCLAPARLLASSDRDAALPARLSACLDGIAAVTDQSDMWHTLRVSGPAAAETLARLLPTDLDPAMFRPGDLALTRAGHVDARIWCVAPLAYEIAVTRSHAALLHHALEQAGPPRRA